MIFGFDIIRGSGVVKEQVEQVSDFRRVKLVGIGTLHIEQNGEESLRLEAEDNILPYLRVEQRGEELILGQEPRVILRPKRPIRFFLKAKDLEAIKLTGSGNILASDLKSERMAIKLTGSGDAEMGKLHVNGELTMVLTGSGDLQTEEARAKETSLRITGSGKTRMTALESERAFMRITGSGGIAIPQVHVTKIESKITGSGDIDMAGETGEQMLRISASGKYRAQDLVSQDASIGITGSGSASVNVSGKLDTHISGSGSVDYSGNPVVITSVSGAGKVRSVNI
jgi:hypothetical protein